MPWTPSMDGFSGDLPPIDYGAGVGVTAIDDDAGFGNPAISFGGGNTPLLQSTLSIGPTGAGLTPVSVLVGLIGLLLVMKILGESSKTAIQPAHWHIGPYNVVATTVTVIIGIVLMKMLFNKWQVPGVTDIVNAV